MKIWKVQVNVTEALHKQLSEEAWRNRQSVSGYIRSLIEEARSERTRTSKSKRK